MSKLGSVWNFLGRHKYVITIVAFGILIVFLDDNSLVRRMGYSREINSLREEIVKYRADYDESTRRLNELKTNPDAMEKVAREKYMMKKPDEDIYVFEDNP
ncbi:MAG: septum formation initiator family protein [Mediterranea sp.]|jgi:cell division protein FtsB|nr:septum formation initiator family protein [Mediterranea sp.]